MSYIGDYSMEDMVARETDIHSPEGSDTPRIVITDTLVTDTLQRYFNLERQHLLYQKDDRTYRVPLPLAQQKTIMHEASNDPYVDTLVDANYGSSGRDIPIDPEHMTTVGQPLEGDDLVLGNLGEHTFFLIRNRDEMPSDSVLDRQSFDPAIHAGAIQMMRVVDTTDGPVRIFTDPEPYFGKDPANEFQRLHDHATHLTPSYTLRLLQFAHETHPGVRINGWVPLPMETAQALALWNPSSEAGGVTAEAAL